MRWRALADKRSSQGLRCALTFTEADLPSHTQELFRYSNVVYFGASSVRKGPSGLKTVAQYG